MRLHFMRMDGIQFTLQTLYIDIHETEEDALRKIKPQVPRDAKAERKKAVRAEISNCFSGGKI